MLVMIQIRRDVANALREPESWCHDETILDGHRQNSKVPSFATLPETSSALEDYRANWHLDVEPGAINRSDEVLVPFVENCLEKDCADDLLRRMFAFIEELASDPEAEIREAAQQTVDCLAPNPSFRKEKRLMGPKTTVIFIAHDRRHIPHVNATFNPTAAWVNQPLREAFPCDTAPMHLIFERYAMFRAALVQCTKAMGINSCRTAYRCPWQNRVAERWVGTCRREPLDREWRQPSDRRPSALLPSTAAPAAWLSR